MEKHSREEELEEDAPLLGEERGVVPDKEKKSFAGDSDQQNAFHQDRGDMLSREGSDDKPTTHHTSGENKSSTSKFQRRRLRNSDKLLSSQGDAKNEASSSEKNDHQSEGKNKETADHNVELESHHINQVRRKEHCCMPVASCLAASFSRMGFGFRRDNHFETFAGQEIDSKMWDTVKESDAFVRVQDTAFCIKLWRLSDLQGILGSAVKPFVKVHMVDVDTGHYVRPCSTGKVKMGRSAPVLTRQASLQGTSSDVPIWSEEIYFPNLTFKDAVSPNNLLLFEILDDPPSLSFRKARSIKSAKDMRSSVKSYTALAWAFLLPVGQKVNVGFPKQEDIDESKCNPELFDLPLRLQLYQYKKDNWVTNIQRLANRWPAAEMSQQKRSKTETVHRYPDDIPEVYFQYKRKHLETLHSVLEISTGFRLSFQQSSSEKLDSDVLDSDAENQKQELEPRSSQAAEDQAKAQLRKAKMKRSRAPTEPCVIPNKLLHRIDVGPEGAMVVKYSHKGDLLAIAGVTTGAGTVPFAPVGGTSPYGDVTYAVRLFDSDTGVEVWSDLSAHFGVIYDLKWSISDSYLLSCSSDGCCKVWRIIDDQSGRRASGSPTRKSTQAKQNRRSSLAGMGLHANVALSGFQDSPLLVATMAHHPPAYVYTSVFQEYKAKGHDGDESNELPVVLSGASDGRIRVWQGANMVGELLLGSSSNKAQSSPSGQFGLDDEPDVDINKIPHFGAKVQALAIDPRSRYLFSGDSEGNILIWRKDGVGWYQLLRQFRKDDLHGKSISSLEVYPERAKGYLLVMALPALTVAQSESLPVHGRINDSGYSSSSMVLSSALLKLYDLGTYKAQHTFPGLVVNNSFCRAAFSADGRFATCGTIIRNHNGVEKNHIRIWDTLTGRYQDTKLSSLPFSYIPRSVSWHPKQHVLAISMVGQGAAVGIYCANKGKAEDVANSFDVAEQDYQQAAPTFATETKQRHISSSSPSRLRKGYRRFNRKGENEPGDQEIRTKEQRAARTKEILEKIKSAKARAQAEFS